MTPQTDREWAKALAAVHPEGKTPDPVQWAATIQARDDWRKARPAICRRCQKPFPLRPSYRAQRYCTKYCAILALAVTQRKRRTLRRAPSERTPGLPT